MDCIHTTGNSALILAAPIQIFLFQYSKFWMKSNPNPSLIQSKLSKHRWDLFSIALLGLLIVVFLWRVVLLGQVMLPIDVLYRIEPWKSESIDKLPVDPVWNPNLTDSIWQLYPALTYADNARHSGEGYFWDPNMLGGMPAMARGDMFLNPVVIFLSTFLNIEQLLNWTAVIHLFLAGVFMYMLLRELNIQPFGALVGALAYSYNSYLISWLALAFLANTAIWLPLILWSIERAIRRNDWRWTIAGAVGFALQIVYGYILWPLYGGITLGLIAIYRSSVFYLEKRGFRGSIKPLLYTGLTLGMGVLLAMPQLAPTIQLFPNTGRDTAYSNNLFLDLKEHLIRLIAPKVFGDRILGNPYRSQSNYPETALYFGIITLFFIGGSIFSDKRKSVWGLVGIGGITLLAVYAIWPFKEIVTFLYPVFLNTNPARVFYVVVFTWSIAAGIGADWLVRERPPFLLKWLRILAFMLAGGFLLLWWLRISIETQPANILPAMVFRILKKADPNSLLVASVFLIMTALLFWIWTQRRLPQTAIKVPVLIFLVGDLFWVGINYNSTFDSKYVFPKTPSLEFLSNLHEEEKEPFRVIPVESSMIVPGMTPGLLELQSVSGYTSWVLDRYTEYTLLTGNRWQKINHVYFDDCCHRLIDALNVKYVYTPTGTPLADLDPNINLSTQLAEAQIESEFAKGVANTTWAFDNHAVPVLYQHPTSRITFELFFEQPAKLITGITMDPKSWGKPGDGVRFEITIRPDLSDQKELVFSQYINPKQNPSDRIITPIEVNLDDYTGQIIHLSLVTRPGPEENTSYDWAGWINPTIEVQSTHAALKLIYDGPNKIYENTDAFPRAWIVHRVTHATPGDIETVKQYLRNPLHDLAQEAIIESLTDLDLFADFSKDTPAMGDKVNFVEYSPEHVLIQAELEQPGLLVLSDVMYPGWKAYVNGTEQEILTTDLIMRGVFLPEGQHTIEFVYRPYAFQLGIAVASATFTIMVIAFFITTKHFPIDPNKKPKNDILHGENLQKNR